LNQKASVLVVDDDSGIRKTLSKILEKTATQKRVNLLDKRPNTNRHPKNAFENLWQKSSKIIKK